MICKKLLKKKLIFIALPNQNIREVLLTSNFNNINIEMPILESVFNILYNGFNIQDEINKLMSRPIKIENVSKKK